MISISGREKQIKVTWHLPLRRGRRKKKRQRLAELKWCWRTRGSLAVKEAKSAGRIGAI